MKQLYLSLNKAGLMFKSHTERGEIDFIHLETDDNGTTCSVDVNTFEILFGDVQENPNYAALSGTHTFKLEDTQYTMTAEEMGYQKYFDKWKEQGLFN
ncbi:hypothetical protein [Priestia megaterium]|uniref:hypothetical protein n=1 Tax=Priestia megaterium TaxID=1404 RepID=UPI00207A8FF7|nr:hypothetical protein [Priestia megaterium]USL27525.1 hypothetical protein LIT33_27595 [Priestia megaterium]USL33436.1 hypothetical protein LIT30_27895 [Priestia megaterium]USL39368.1 hypothetical protein LIT34_29515 [Priestia megaterium]WDM31528.1 hypothetical protein J8N01_00565 [Priestia megaterium]